VDESILALLIADKNITYTQMAENFGVSRKTIALRIKALKEKGQIARIGSDTNGYWEVYHF
jgi:ATP-dependent DNA helicase RecG